MAITFVGSATATWTDISTPEEITLPTGVQENDIVFVLVGVAGQSDYTLDVTTAGYVEITELYAENITESNLSVSWKRMGSTPDTTVSCDSNADSTYIKSAIVYVLRGVDTTTAFDITSKTATMSNSSYPNAPDVTPETYGAYVVACGFAALASASGTATATTPQGFSNQIILPSGPTAYDSALIVASREWHGFGLQEVERWAITDTQTHSQSSWCAVTVTLRPATPGSAPTSTLVETDFSEYTTGSNLSDWSTPWASTGFTFEAEANSGDEIVGSKWLDFQATANSRKVVTWDDVGTVSDCNVLALLKIPSAATTSNNGPRICCRVSGSVGAENDYHLVFGLNGIALNKYVAGTSTAIRAADGLFSSLHIWVRLYAIGTTLKAKVWDVNALEPYDWLIDVTDSSLSTGTVGISSYYIAEDFQCDYFACAEGEEIVPFPVDGWEHANEFGALEAFETEGTLTTVNFLGGNFPFPGKILTGAKVYVGATHTSQLRVAAYSGGSLISGPEGATLLHDFGASTGTDVNQWYEFTGANVAIPEDKPLWFVFKADGGISFYSTSGSNNAGDFQAVRGRYRITAGISNDETVAWDEELSGLTGDFADYWYGVALVTEDAAPSPSSNNQFNTFINIIL